MNIMVGEVEELTNNLCAFVRLREARDLGKITEVDLPTRFLFVLLVPRAHLDPAIEAGRCMGTLMTDEVNKGNKVSPQFSGGIYICSDHGVCPSVLSPFNNLYCYSFHYNYLSQPF